MTNSSRAAMAAAQSNPDENPSFRRWWGDGGATGPDTTAVRAWHASDVPAPPMSRARRQAENEWLKVTGRTVR